MGKPKEEKRPKWILENLNRNALKGDILNSDLVERMSRAGAKWLGHAIAAGPFEAHISLDFTGSPGSVSGIYYSLCFWLRKWEYQVQKSDEWIEVSPVHAQYYQLTQKQKEELEGKIKQGLVSVSQSVADMELLMHDRRRYHEFLHYLGYKTPKEWMKTDDKTEKEHNHPEEEMDDICLVGDDKRDKLIKESIDNHSLKAVFIDQVDMHTGEGISMRSIISRWPTLITDFIKMEDSDMDPDKVKNKLDVSKAEAVILITKNKLYQEWKNIFGPEIKNRYTRIHELVKARETSVEQYKEWLKPYVARHKLIQEGLARESNRKSGATSFITSGGTATSSAEIVLYVWKDFIVPELYKGGSEDMAKITMGSPGKRQLEVDDKWTKQNLIFGKKFGLINAYPWITEEWVQKQKEEMFSDGWLTTHKPYYSFFQIKIMKTGIRMPTGEELEDGIFDVNMFFMTQNVVFCKLLELKAKQQEMEHHIDKLLGVYKSPQGKVPTYAVKNESAISKVLDKFSMTFEMAKRGPYERDFDERLTKVCFARCAGERYGPIVGYIKKKMGIPGS